MRGLRIAHGARIGDARALVGASAKVVETGRVRALAGAIGAPIAFVLLLVLPLPLEPAAHRLAAIFGAILILWLSEAVHIAATALLIAPLLVVCDVAAPKDAFKHYADPLLYLFVGGFIIAEAMRKHGLDRRIAKAIVGSRWVRGVPVRARIALIVASLALSMWISNTAATAILTPICLGMAGPPKPDDRAATGSLLAIAFGCSISGLGTVVGSPPNLITLRLLREGGVTLGFVDWMLVGLPTAVVLLVALFVITQRLFPPGEAAADASEVFADVPAVWTRGEAATAVSFGLAVAGWTVPGVANALWLPIAPVLDRYLEPGVVAIFAASLLFFVPEPGGGRVLHWSDAAKIDWGIILLFGGGIALGTALVDTGLAAALSERFVAATGISSLWTLTAVSIVATIVFSELCSNTATANMLVPLIVAVTTSLGVSPIPPVLGVGIAASAGFMLPIATGPNALVYGTGRVPQTHMIRAGLLLDTVSAVAIFALLRILCPLLGWA